MDSMRNFLTNPDTLYSWNTTLPGTGTPGDWHSRYWQSPQTALPVHCAGPRGNPVTCNPVACNRPPVAPAVPQAGPAPPASLDPSAGSVQEVLRTRAK